MKRILLSAATAFAISSAAAAADLPARGPAVAPAPVFVAMNWTGFYVGAQVGYTFGRTRHVFSIVAPTDNSDPDGVIGGLHAGYNFQSGALVFGVEADINASGARGSFVNLTGITSSGSSRYDWIGTLRARLGYAFDRTLIYATGGGAYADWRYRGGPAFAPSCCGFNKSKLGWTIGAGVEHAFTNNWTARIEYRYTDFGSTNGGLAPLFPAVNMRVNSKTHSVMVGLSYLFNSRPGSVVARY